jgi:hypothetical protein
VNRYIVSLLILLGTFSYDISLGANPIMSVVPDSTRIELDSNLVVTIPVSANSSHLKAYSLTLSFDRNVIRTDMAHIQEGPLLATSGLLTFFWTSFSPDSSLLYIDGAILGDGTSVSGGGNLATISFSSVDYGESQILIASIRARDENNRPLTYDALNGWTQVCRYKGDVNADNAINISDAVYLIAWIFSGGPAPIPALLVGDVNCDNTTNISDCVYIIAYIFCGGPAPCGPCYP